MFVKNLRTTFEFSFCLRAESMLTKVTVKEQRWC